MTTTKPSAAAVIPAAVVINLGFWSSITFLPSNQGGDENRCGALPVSRRLHHKDVICDLACPKGAVSSPSVEESQLKHQPMPQTKPLGTLGPTKVNKAVSPKPDVRPNGLMAISERAGLEMIWKWGRVLH